MDNFMDRLAQRLNAQEIIRANVAAETAELEQLRDQVEAYDASLKKMQLMSDTNAQNVVKIEAILEAYSTQLDGYGDELTKYADRLESYGSELTQYASKLHEYQEVVQSGDASGATKEELEKSLSTLRDELMEMQEHIEEFSHKENVKVYRNVQAAVAEELGKRITELLEQIEEKSGETQAKVAEGANVITRRQDELGRQLAGIQELINQLKQSGKSKTATATLIMQIATLVGLIANFVLLLYAAGII